MKEWLIEFDEEEYPIRELGLDNHGKVILAAPNKINRGLWTDSDMKLKDFENNIIDAKYFLTLWDNYSKKN